MEIPEVKYARSGDVHIAYQVMGEGPDLIFTPTGINHLLLRLELPANVRFIERLASFSRLILWDRRGTGMSDRHGALPTLDLQMDDLRAVMEATGAERPTLFGQADGACLTALFAASFPDQVHAAVLYAMTPRFLPSDDDDLGIGREFLRIVREGADPDALLEQIAPSVAGDPVVRDWWRRNARMSASPGTMAQLLETWIALDLRPILPTISVPTTVIQRKEDLVNPPPNGREAARLIPGARYVEIPGDFAGWSGGGAGTLLDEIEEAATGERHRRPADRMLASILFTDIVGSTTEAARLGDAGWRTLLDEHDAFVERRIGALGGRLVKSLGDGALAIFDSPARAVRCGAEIVDGLAARAISVRAGVHTGECERRGDDIGGIAVHIAARVGALAQPGEVLVTGTVRDLVFGSELSFEDRGPHELRGVPGTWPLLALAR